MNNETAEKPKRIKRQMLGKDLWTVRAMPYVAAGLIILAAVTMKWIWIVVSVVVYGFYHISKDAGVTTEFPGAETFYVYEDEAPSSSDGDSGGGDGGGGD